MSVRRDGDYFVLETVVDSEEAEFMQACAGDNPNRVSSAFWMALRLAVYLNEKVLDEGYKIAQDNGAGGASFDAELEERLHEAIIGPVAEPEEGTKISAKLTANGMGYLLRAKRTMQAPTYNEMMRRAVRILYQTQDVQQTLKLVHPNKNKKEIVLTKEAVREIINSPM